MISVLIPTYDYKCYAIVRDMQRQLELCSEEYEVLVADDGGRDQVVAIANHMINELPHCRYVRRRENVGRAAIRNVLANEAKGEWLLFADSDAKVVRDDFISKYQQSIDDTTRVIVGGLVNPESMPSPLVSLRYRYEKAAEYQRTVEYRTKMPYSHFTTFNVLMHRSVWQQIPFDENCTEYGYEDALMGVEMQKHGIAVKHIDNPLMHMGFESNEVFLRKSLKAIDTLKKLGDKMVPYSHLGMFEQKLRRYHLTPFVRIAYFLLRPALKKNLLGTNPNVKVFAFYKLGYFLS